MANFQIPPPIPLHILLGPAHLWSGGAAGGHGGWAGLLVLLFLLLWQLRRLIPRRVVAGGVGATSSLVKSVKSDVGIAKIVANTDLKILIGNLEGKLDENEKWEDVIDKKNNTLSYKAKCCKPKDGPLKYFSVTTFENCSTELLKDFYMDNEYRKKWDKTLVAHEQLQIEEATGIEMGRTVKKFPLLTPREYVLAWRLWEGNEKTFYCFSKECESPLAPRQSKFVRVRFFRSGWRIRRVPGRDACEIAMVHQEDAGLNAEMAKLAFSKGIWSYICKMDAALRKYSPVSHDDLSSNLSAVKLVQKVPPDLDFKNKVIQGRPSETLASERKANLRSSFKKPSKVLVANGLLLVGGIVCLTRGPSSLSAKLAVACILKKLSEKRNKSASSSTPELGCS